MPSSGRRAAKRGVTSPDPSSARASLLARAGVDAYEHLGLAVAANLMLVLGSVVGVLPAWALAGRSADWAPAAATGVHLLFVCPALWLAAAALATDVARGRPVGFRGVVAVVGSRYAAGVVHMAVGVAAASCLSVTIAFWSSSPLTGSPYERLVAVVWCGVGLVGAAAWVHGWSLLAIRAAGAGALYRAARAMAADRRSAAVLILQFALALAAASLPLWLRWQGVAATFAVMLVLFFVFFWLLLVSAHGALAGEAGAREVGNGSLQAGKGAVAGGPKRAT